MPAASFQRTRRPSLAVAVVLCPALARADRGALSLDLGTGITALALRPPYAQSGDGSWTLALSVSFGVRYALTNQLELTLGGFYDLPAHVTHAAASIPTVDSGTFTGTLEYELSRFGALVGVRYVTGLVVRVCVGGELGWSHRTLFRPPAPGHDAPWRPGLRPRARRRRRRQPRPPAAGRPGVGLRRPLERLPRAAPDGAARSGARVRPLGWSLHLLRVVPLNRPGRSVLLSVLLAGAAEAAPDGCARILGPGSDAYDAEIQGAVASVASVWPVPHSFVKAVIHRESGFRPRALSPAGAVGLMQVMPANARRLGVTPAQLWTPATNILAGTRLLAVLLRHYRGDVISTLVAYNAGPRRPLAPVPENGETPGYVQGVLASWRVLRRCEASAHAAAAERRVAG